MDNINKITKYFKYVGHSPVGYSPALGAGAGAGGGLKFKRLLNYFLTMMANI